jgi:hypothetical protein
METIYKLTLITIGIGIVFGLYIIYNNLTQQNTPIEIHISIDIPPKQHPLSDILQQITTSNPTH